MLDTEALIWLILGGTGTVCVVSMLGVFASVMRHQTHLHDLRNRVSQLHYDYALRLARLQGQIEDEEGEVDIIEAVPVEEMGLAGATAQGISDEIEAVTAA